MYREGDSRKKLWEQCVQGKESQCIQGDSVGDRTVCTGGGFNLK